MISATLIGVVLGVVSGLLPGIGTGSIMLVFLFYLVQIPATHALVLYLGIVISSQYVASVTAIYTGIPGAESAAPTAKEYPTLRRLGLSHIAIVQNATMSVLGNVIGLLGFIVIIPLLTNLTSVYQIHLKLGILLLTFLTVILVDERKWVALASILAAAYLSSIGPNPHTFEIHNFGIPQLSAGLSWVALVMGALIGSSQAQLKSTTLKGISAPTTISPSRWVGVSCAGVRGSVLGFIIGFIPGLSYILSSILSYSVEGRLQRARGSNEATTTLRSIAASEAAQSAGSVSMLVPLLVFGIPITVSEGIILNVLTLSSDLKTIVTELSDNFLVIGIILLVINLLGLVFALYSRHLLNWLFKIPIVALRIGLVLFGAIAVWNESDFYPSVALLTYVLVLLAFSRLRVNPLPFVMSVLLYPTLLSTIYIFKELY